MCGNETEQAGAPDDGKVEALGKLIDSALSLARSTPNGEVLVYMLDVARSEVQVLSHQQ